MRGLIDERKGWRPRSGCVCVRAICPKELLRALQPDNACQDDVSRCRGARTRAFASFPPANHSLDSLLTF